MSNYIADVLIITTSIYYLGKEIKSNNNEMFNFPLSEEWIKII